MKQIVLLLLIVSSLISCDKTTEVMRIIVKNDTGKIIKIKLFPKSEYLNERGDAYCFQYNGAGYRETEFELGIDSLNSITQKILYYNDDIGLSPTDLVAKIYDSIHVIAPLVNDSLVIRFLPSSISGYNENLFTNVSAWEYELKNYGFPTQTTTTHEKAHEYCFIVSEDKFEFGK